MAKKNRTNIHNLEQDLNKCKQHVALSDSKLTSLEERQLQQEIHQ